MRWWFRTVAFAQPPKTTSVCLETGKLIKNGFGQVGLELNRPCFMRQRPLDETSIVGLATVRCHKALTCSVLVFLTHPISHSDGPFLSFSVQGSKREQPHQDHEGGFCRTEAPASVVSVSFCLVPSRLSYVSLQTQV